MSIIELIKKNIRGKEKTKLLTGKIEKAQIEDLCNKLEDIICIADCEENIEYLNHGEEKTLKELMNYNGNEILYKEM